MKKHDYTMLVLGLIVVISIMITILIGAPKVYELDNGGEQNIKLGKMVWFITTGNLEVEAASEDFFIFRDKDGYRVYVPDPAESPLDRPDNDYFVLPQSEIPEGEWTITDGYFNTRFSGDGEIMVGPTIPAIWGLFCTALSMTGLVAFIVINVLLKRRDGK